MNLTFNPEVFASFSIPETNLGNLMREAVAEKNTEFIFIIAVVQIADGLASLVENPIIRRMARQQFKSMDDSILLLSELNKNIFGGYSLAELVDKDPSNMPPEFHHTYYGRIEAAIKADDKLRAAEQKNPSQQSPFQ